MCVRDAGHHTAATLQHQCNCSSELGYITYNITFKDVLFSTLHWTLLWNINDTVLKWRFRLRGTSFRSCFCWISSTLLTAYSCRPNSWHMQRFEGFTHRATCTERVGLLSQAGGTVCTLYLRRRRRIVTTPTLNLLENLCKGTEEAVHSDKQLLVRDLLACTALIFTMCEIRERSGMRSAQFQFNHLRGGDQFYLVTNWLAEGSMCNLSRCSVI